MGGTYVWDLNWGCVTAGKLPHAVNQWLHLHSDQDTIVQMPKLIMTSLHWQTSLQNRQCHALCTLGRTSKCDKVLRPICLWSLQLYKYWATPYGCLWEPAAWKPTPNKRKPTGLREIKAKPRLINKLDRTNQCYEYLRKQQAELITICPYITYMCNLLVILLFIDPYEPLTL